MLRLALQRGADGGNGTTLRLAFQGGADEGAVVPFRVLFFSLLPCGKEGSFSLLRAVFVTRYLTRGNTKPPGNSTSKWLTSSEPKPNISHNKETILDTLLH